MRVEIETNVDFAYSLLLLAVKILKKGKISKGSVKHYVDIYWKRIGE